jgi:hypothetical protein
LKKNVKTIGIAQNILPRKLRRRMGGDVTG